MGSRVLHHTKVSEEAGPVVLLAGCSVMPFNEVLTALAALSKNLQYLYSAQRVTLEISLPLAAENGVRAVQFDLHRRNLERAIWVLETSKQHACIII